MKYKIKEWIKRYVPAEIASLLATIGAGMLAFSVTKNRAVTALAATWAGNVAYFGYILIQDIFNTRKKLHAQQMHYTKRIFLQNIRALFIEFGVAELLDSFVIRPALMYYLPLWMNHLSAGILTAKIIADITFYVPAIISYELSKKKFRRFE